MNDLFDTSHDAPLGEILGVLPAVMFATMLAGALTHRSMLRLSTSVHMFVAAVLLAGLLLVIGFAVTRRQQERLTVSCGLVLITACIAVTVFGVATREQLRHTSTIAALVENRSQVTIDGHVVTEPRPVGGRWLTMIKTRQVDGVPVRERVAVLHTTDPPALGVGVHFRAAPRALTGNGFHRWLAQQHATVLFEPQLLTFDLSRQGMFARASEIVRARTRQAASRHMSPTNAGLMVALVTGDRRLINPDDAEAMRNAGMSHLTAVSGMHLAVFSAGVLAVLMAAGVSASTRRLLLSLALVWFAFVTRFQPSVLRAGVMALIVVYGASRGRVSDARHALSVAVLLLVSVDPQLAASVGLQLSAVATTGVLLIGPRVARRLPKQIPSRLRQVIAVTGGAQLAVLPLLIGTFGSVSLAAFPANVLAASVAGAAAMTGFIGAVAAVIHPAFGGIVFHAATPLATIILQIARFFAAWPVAITPGVFLWCAVGVLGIWVARSFGRSSPRSR